MRRRAIAMRATDAWLLLFTVLGLSTPTVGMQQLSGTCPPDWSPTFAGDTGATGGSPMYALAAFDDGTGAALYAGGIFTGMSGLPINALAKWDGSTWSALGTGIPTGGVTALEVFDDGTGPALYVAGGFPTAGGVTVNKIAKWDGAVWSSLGTGLPSGQNIFDLHVFDDGSGPKLYAGGDFTSIGGVSANRIAMWNGTSWSPLGSGLTMPLSNPCEVYCMTVFDDGAGAELYVGGRFRLAGSATAERIAKWNGSTWAALGTGLDAPSSYPHVVCYSLTVFDDGAGPALHVGGAFTTAGGIASEGIAKWRGSTWSTVGGGTGAGSRVYASEVHDDGSGPKLIVGGAFTAPGGVAALNVARWDGSAWSAMGNGLSSEPTDFLAFDDGTGPALWAGGFFQNSGTVVARRIAKWSGACEVGVGYCFGDATCPCASAESLTSGCENAIGGNGRLSAIGTASIASDRVVLRGTNMPNGAVLYFQGTARISTPFGDGLLCAGGSLQRLGVKFNFAGASEYPQAGDPPISMAGAIVSAGTFDYQAWYRDALTYCTPATFNLTNGWEITWSL